MSDFCETFAGNSRDPRGNPESSDRPVHLGLCGVAFTEEQLWLTSGVIQECSMSGWLCSRHGLLDLASCSIDWLSVSRILASACLGVAFRSASTLMHMHDPIGHETQGQRYKVQDCSFGTSLREKKEQLQVNAGCPTMCNHLYLCLRSLSWTLDGPRGPAKYIGRCGSNILAAYFSHFGAALSESVSEYNTEIILVLSLLTVLHPTRATCSR